MKVFCENGHEIVLPPRIRRNRRGLPVETTWTCRKCQTETAVTTRDCIVRPSRSLIYQQLDQAVPKEPLT